MVNTSGISKIGISVTIKLVASSVLAGILQSAAYAEIPPYPLFVGKTIYQVYEGDRPQLRLLEHEQSRVIFHADTTEVKIEKIDCARSVSIGVGYGLTRMGMISVSMCSDAVISESTAATAQKNTEKYLKNYAAFIGDKGDRLLEHYSSYFKTMNLASGMLYAFPVIYADGHTAIKKTLIAVPETGGDTVVIQYGIKLRFCELAPDTRLCKDPENSMQELAQLFLEKWPEKKKQL